jgi:hypothetical protein
VVGAEITSPEAGEAPLSLADVLQRLVTAIERSAGFAAPAAAGLARGMALAGHAGIAALREQAKARDEALAKRLARRRAP